MMKIKLKNKNGILQYHYENITIQEGQKWNLNGFFDKEINKNLSPGITEFYNYLKEITVLNDYNDFNRCLLTADPETLEAFKVEIENNHGGALNSVITKPNGSTITVRQDLLRIFFYDDYTKWKAYPLAQKINLNVCPYCNRSYTFVHYSDSKGKFYTRFEYDHFISRAKYPYLGLSFFNLVPSCHICNSNLKKDKEFNLKKHFHPYNLGFEDDYKFTLDIDQIEFLNGKTSSYKIEFRKNPHSLWDNEKLEAANRNIKVFQLKELYNLHRDYVDEIITKKYIYTEDKIDELFEQYEGILFSSKEEVRRIIFGNYLNIQDQNKRVLSKLTADIISDLENKDWIT